MDRIRSFVAVRLPEDVRAALAAEVTRLAPAARDVGWVAPDNLHLTLKFLGGVEEARLELVRAALVEVGGRLAAFELAVAGLGAFPTPARPRVIWAGVTEGVAALAGAAREVEGALTALGFPAEARAYAAHVTLGRVRVPRRQPALEAALAAAAGHVAGRVAVRALSLMRSDLSPRGARYTELAAIPLLGPAPAAAL